MWEVEREQLHMQAVAVCTSKAGGYVRPGVEVDSTTLPPPITCCARTFHLSCSSGAHEFVCVRAWLRSQGRRKDSKLWCCHCPTNFACLSRSPPGLQQPSSASGLQGGRGPQIRAIDSTTNSTNIGGGRALNVELLQAAHEHQHEDPSRSW